MEVDTNPPDTIVCLLCRGAVTYIDNDSSAFFRHLKQEHSVHYDHHFLLSVTFFDDDSKKMVVQNFEENMERNKTEKLITDERDITDLDDFEELDDEETLDESVSEVEHEDMIEDDLFKCNVCAKSFKSGFELKRHASTHTGNSQLQDERKASTKEPDVEMNETGKKFKCEKCGQEFDLHNILLLHKLKHGESYNTKCEVCTTVFSSRGNLIKHINRKHKDGQSYKSPNSTPEPELPKKSQTPNYVSDPAKTPFKNSIPTGVTEKSLAEVVKNTESKDDTTVPHKCFQCKAEFLTSKQFIKHKSNTKHQIFPPQGDTTKQQINPPQGDAAANIKKELIDVNQIKKEVYKGTGEDVKNIKKENISTHNETENTDSKIMNNDTGDADSKIECKVCSKVFRTRKLLSGHNSKIHTPKPYSCEDCPKSFVDWLNLRRHAYQYHPANAKKALDLLTKKTAESVDKTDSGIANLDNEAKHAADFKKKISEVLDDEDVLIDESGINRKRNRTGGDNTSQDKKNRTAGDNTSQDATISFQSILANAMAKKNDSEDNDKLDINTEESLECKICDKMFDSSAKLKRHKLIHNGEKPYKCDVCDSSFNQRANLKRHKNSCHE